MKLYNKSNKYYYLFIIVCVNDLIILLNSLFLVLLLSSIECIRLEVSEIENIGKFYLLLNIRNQYKKYFTICYRSPHFSPINIF